MEDFVAMIIGGGMLLVGGLWGLELIRGSSLGWAISVGLAALGIGVLAVGIGREIDW